MADLDDLEEMEMVEGLEDFDAKNNDGLKFTK